MNVDAYLARIGFSGPLEPTQETLDALHLAHLLTVPFENLDIHLPRRITLDRDRIYDKIVNERRGGFCYEVNGLFAALLQELGFTVRLLSARVAMDDGGRGPEFDHLLIMVDLDQPLIADVGAFRKPFRLDEQRCEIDNRCWRIEQRGEEWVMLRRDDQRDWADDWAFTLDARQFEEFAAMCDHHQTSPDSHFMRNHICSRATPDGRITLTNDLFVITRAGYREEIPVEDDASRRRLLREKFGVVLPDGISAH